MKQLDACVYCYHFLSNSEGGRGCDVIDGEEHSLNTYEQISFYFYWSGFVTYIHDSPTGGLTCPKFTLLSEIQEIMDRTPEDHLYRRPTNWGAVHDAEEEI